MLAYLVVCSLKDYFTTLSATIESATTESTVESTTTLSESFALPLAVLPPHALIVRATAATNKNTNFFNFLTFSF